MVYYEPRVTQADKDRISDRLSRYMLYVRHDADQYRHLHCHWPDDPIGPGNCSFDVITAPGSITIYGDWMRAFTLRRYGNQDMLLDFCTQELNVAYWAEKLDMEPHAKNAAITAIDTDAFFEDVRESLTQWLIEGEIQHTTSDVDAVMTDIRDDISFDETSHPFEQLLDSSIWIASSSYPGNARDIFDPEDTPGEHYTLEWIRTCMALQWAAQTYEAARSYKQQKQTRRYLMTERRMHLNPDDFPLPEKPSNVVGI